MPAILLEKEKTFILPERQTQLTWGLCSDYKSLRLLNNGKVVGNTTNICLVKDFLALQNVLHCAKNVMMPYSLLTA